MTVLVFDVGGTRLKAGLAAPSGIASLTALPTEVASADALVAQMTGVGRQLLGGERPSAIGVSIKGIVESERGLLVDVNAPLDPLSGEPLGERLAEAFEAPVYVENDARMHALGEFHHGAGRDAENLVCLTLGTGIGVGVVIDGQLIRGTRGVLGILAGHITVDVDGPPCTCGNVGCLEALIGTAGLVADAQARALDHPGSRLSTKAVDPEVVVIGGGLSASAPYFLNDVQRFADQHAWTQPKGRVRIAASRLGDTAALVGAAELANRALEL